MSSGLLEICYRKKSEGKGRMPTAYVWATTDLSPMPGRRGRAHAGNHGRGEVLTSRPALC